MFEYLDRMGYYYLYLPNKEGFDFWSQVAGATVALGVFGYFYILGRSMDGGWACSVRKALHRLLAMGFALGMTTLIVLSNLGSSLMEFFF